MKGDFPYQRVESTNRCESLGTGVLVFKHVLIGLIRDYNFRCSRVLSF